MSGDASGASVGGIKSQQGGDAHGGGEMGAPSMMASGWHGMMPTGARCSTSPCPLAFFPTEASST